MKKAYTPIIKIAILTRPDYRSPRILAESLKIQLEKAGVESSIYFSIDVLTRLTPFHLLKSKIKFHFWLRRKLTNYLSDKAVINRLKNYDAVVLSECSPNSFWKDNYQVEKLKKLLKKPILLYEVYYLQNAPTQIETLRKNGDPLMDRYDWHLSVSSITEIRGINIGNWSSIGLDLSNYGLKPVEKAEFVAVIDFKQPGYESYQEEQIRVLQELNVKTIVLCGKYTLEEIRDIYRQASIFFVQFPEAFGLPIAECLACGVQIFTPNSGWPMAWRLDDHPEVHAPGILPDVFCTYNNYSDLKEKIISFRKSYDLSKTPKSIFNKFIKYYHHYYYGNLQEIREVIKRLREGTIETI
jgi:hypothetical protein